MAADIDERFFGEQALPPVVETDTPVEEVHETKLEKKSAVEDQPSSSIGFGSMWTSLFKSDDRKADIPPLPPPVPDKLPEKLNEIARMAPGLSAPTGNKAINLAQRSHRDKVTIVIKLLSAVSCPAADPILGTVDPYVEARLVRGDESQHDCMAAVKGTGRFTSTVSTVKYSNFNPIWNEDMIIGPVELRLLLVDLTVLHFVLMDKDFTSDDDALGDTKYKPLMCSVVSTTKSLNTQKVVDGELCPLLAKLDSLKLQSPDYNFKVTSHYH
jgi:hypothetical protein